MGCRNRIRSCACGVGSLLILGCSPTVCDFPLDTPLDLSRESKLAVFIENAEGPQRSVYFDLEPGAYTLRVELKALPPSCLR